MLFSEPWNMSFRAFAIFAKAATSATADDGEYTEVIAAKRKTRLRSAKSSLLLGQMSSLTGSVTSA